jgi:signal transduction histidine kinase
VAFVPGLFAARPFGRRAGSGGGSWRSGVALVLKLLPGRFAARLAGRLGSSPAAESGRSPRALVESFDVLLAALTPGVALMSQADVNSVEVWPIVVWLAVLLIATRQLLRPLARLAASATHQRDMVVAATEAERARIAADIHDDALQDLSMLVRRLDEAGDGANAQAGREIVERLRAICGDLRLPVLDDLGVGPALEWLCGRMDPSGTEIRLDRLPDESRLPADVELAVFRITQEALSNAIRHGDTPIAVRYRARPDWLELEVDDSGRGIAEDSAAKAEQTGHMGLLNMTQRAEAIGAGLQIGRRPEGGTRVRLIWDRATARGAVAAPAPA